MIDSWILVLTWLLGGSKAAEAYADNRSSLDPNG